MILGITWWILAIFTAFFIFAVFSNLVRNDNSLLFWTVILSVAVIGFLAFIEHQYYYSVLDFAVFQWKSFGLGILMYSLIGIVWSVFDWRIFIKTQVHDLFLKINQTIKIEKGSENEKITTLDSNSKWEINNVISNFALVNGFKSSSFSLHEESYNLETLPSDVINKIGVLDISRHKPMLINFIIFWPIRVIQYIIGDLLHDIVNNFLNAIKGIYISIAKNAIESAANDLKNQQK